MQQRTIATFSIAAYDPSNGDLGVAVASKFLSVGSIVPWVQADVGAIATQALSNVSYGPRGLALLAAGHSAQETLAALLADDPERESRQVGIVDAHGGVAAHTGSACHDWAGHLLGDEFTVQGNILASAAVVQAIAATFRQATGELAERLLAALSAGEEAGGDRRGRQAAALYVARINGSYGGFVDRYIDLRVDDHPSPISELERLLRLHRFYLTPPDPASLIPLNATVVHELQQLLRRAGYYSGPDTGSYDSATQAALAAYGGVENLEERLVSDTLIDPLVLQFIRDKVNS